MPLGSGKWKMGHSCTEAVVELSDQMATFGLYFGARASDAAVHSRITPGGTWGTVWDARD